jgi:hypothetical protein
VALALARTCYLHFLTRLYEMGRDRADAWLQVNFDSIGLESTVNLTENISDGNPPIAALYLINRQA